MYVEYVSLESIKVKKKERVRQDFGNLKELEQSIKKYGLINPILLTNDYYLVAGHRRYLVIQSLKWFKIPAIVLPYGVSKLDLLELEIEENIQRKDFTKQEIQIYEKKKHRLRYSVLMRLWISMKKWFRILLKRKK